MHRQLDLLGSWARTWPLHLAGAIAATAICLWIIGLTPKLVPAAPGRETWIYSICYCLAMWCWIFAITGAAVRFLSAESRVRRYIADSSYWIYLVHLPVVAAFQVIVSPWPLHWAIKFSLVLVASMAVLLPSYHFLVRYTWIGTVLNGKRHVRTPPSTPPTLPGVRIGRTG